VHKSFIAVGQALVVCCGGLLAAHAGELRAGAGKAAITSLASEFPYAAPHEHPFVGIHDEVYARALLLDDGTQRVALVVVESTRVPDAAGLIGAIAHEIGSSADHVLLAASHTHNVPLVFFHEPEPNALQAEEIARLHAGALAAVRQALAQLGPARIAFGRGQAFINTNNGEQAGLRSGYDPHGPSDKTLDVLRLVRADGSALAVLVDYAAHAEVMFRSVTRAGGYEVSGDLPGAVSRLLESQPGGAPIVLSVPASEADQRTVFKSLQTFEDLAAVDAGPGGWALLDLQAHRLADAVLEVLAKMPAGDAQVHLSAGSAVASCPGQRLRVDATSRAVTSEETAPVNIPLALIRINDIALGGVGGDVAAEIGEHFKAASPVTHSSLISMSNGDVGYLLSDASYEHPGHGVMGSPLKPHCAEPAIIDGLLALIRLNP
jgi:neutral ceramidase